MAPDLAWEPLPAELPDPPETGDTFLANAIQKARFVFEATGRAALADDSGLEVDALGGRPGVFSRRYSPEATDGANNRRLLAELGGVTDRRARYRCVLAWCDAAGVVTAAGSCEGMIGQEPRGTYGFGYDPLFLPDATPGRTMAELSPPEKDRISHRGAALSAFFAELQRCR